MRRHFLTATAIPVAYALAMSGFVHAIPGTYLFVEDPRCDTHAVTLTHELGNPPPIGPFPAGEAIASSSVPVELNITCTAAGPPPPGEPIVPNDFIVSITNLTGIKWVDLFFVADAGITVGNSDGKINDGDAFKIDTAGVNKPLLSESALPDLVFEPGETWIFLVQDWGLPGAFPTPFASIGVGSESDDATGTSWASIVANPVSAPASGWLLGLALAALGIARSRAKAGGKARARD